MDHEKDRERNDHDGESLCDRVNLVELREHR